jgi:hypothetical protein
VNRTIKRRHSRLRTWYFVSRVLQTPVSSIIATKNGTAALDAIFKTVQAQEEDRRISRLLNSDQC